MFLRFLSLVAAVLVMVAAAAGGATLRVCADPDNLPYSNQKQQGFENRIAEVIARDLNANLRQNAPEPQRRRLGIASFFRKPR